MPALVTGRPQADEYATYYGTYISKVTEEDILGVMEGEAARTQAVLRQIGEAKSLFRYSPDKWSIKEVVGHMADTERIMAYRAFRFGRADSQAIPGFEQDDYVRTANFDQVPFVELVQQLADLRRATLSLFKTMDDEAWSRRGTASGNPFSVRALAYIIPGHERHHMQVLHERYGVARP